MKGGEIFTGDRESDTGRDEKRRGRRQPEEEEAVWKERCEITGEEGTRTKRWRYEE